jgi:hypothetical protein
VEHLLVELHAARQSVVISSCHDASPTSGAFSGRCSLLDGSMM